MSYSLVKTVNFGSSRAGLSTVAWSLNGGSTWFTTGVSESPVGSGIYSASIVFADTFVGQLAWTTGEASGQRFAAEDISPPPSSSDLSPVTAALAAITARLDGYDSLTPEVVIADPAPTAGGFTIAMADGTNVPASFAWRQGLAAFPGGGKFSISTYTKLSATTARLAFSPPLPFTPSDATPITIL